MEIVRSSQQDRYPSPSILDITSDELLKIFSLLPQQQRCRTIPLLCRQFANALKQSGELYQLLEVDLTEMDTIVTNPADKACGEMALYDLLCWLTPRAPFVIDLRLHLMEGWEIFAKGTVTGALGACWAVQRLEMSVTGRINVWLPAIFSLTNLKELILTANNTWARLPPALGQLTSLEVLQIKMAIDGGRNMAEKFVPVEMLGCTALRQLSFLDCEGLVISPVIGELMSLQALTVHGVNMRAGRDAIHPCAFQRGSFATASLTSLQLTSCNFDVIPFQICHLHSLRSLDLSQNLLKKLPKLLAAYLRNLAHLDLSRNCFRSIPPVLASLHNLRRLSLAENADLEVCGLGQRQQLGYIGREEAADDGVPLTFVVCSLPELEWLDVRKRSRIHPQQVPQPAQDLWKQACRSVLGEVAAAVAGRARWCSLQHFLYDRAPCAA